MAKEKVYKLARKEFGPVKEGHPVVITHALYGLCSSCKAWWDHSYTSCKADPNVWMHAKTKLDGTTIIAIFWFTPMTSWLWITSLKFVIDYLVLRYTLKLGSVKEPEIYLGSQVSKFYINGAKSLEKP
jgi:hypothetical protein